MLKTRLSLFAIIITVFSVSVLAQTNIPSSFNQKQLEIVGRIIVLESKIEICTMNAIKKKPLTDECAKNYAAQKLPAVYAEAFRDKKLFRLIIRKALKEYKMLQQMHKTHPHFAPYVAKFQRIIIAQNIRIAELHEQLDRKK